MRDISYLRSISSARVSAKLWVWMSALGSVLLGIGIVPQPGSAHPDTANPWLSDPYTRIIRVRAAQIVALPWATMAASGWDLANLPTNQVQVWRQGTQLPIQIDARGIRFRAEPNDSPFSMEAAYWLVVGAEPGLRATTLADTAPFRWEPDTLYQSLVPTARGDHWYAGELRMGAIPLEASISLPKMLPAGARMELALTPFELRSGHQLEIWHGATRVGSTTWDDTLSGPRSLVLTTLAALPSGTSTLRFTLGSAGADIVLLDGFTLPDVSLALPARAPELDLPRSVPDLIAAHELLIVHPDLAVALTPLIQAKQQRGQHVAVVDVLAIYDAYSWGERDPEAIRGFVRDVAMMHSQAALATGGEAHLAGARRSATHAACLPSSAIPCLESVLLVGAGTARMRFGPGEVDTTLIPPYLLDVDAVYGEIACDTCYVRLDAPDPRHDVLPDLALGRLPARTLAEAEVMVAKTIAAYQSARPPSPSGGPLRGTSAAPCLPAPSAACPGALWSQKMLLVADNDRDALGAPDGAGPFTPLLDTIAQGLPQLIPARFVYAPDQVRGDGVYQQAADLRHQLFAAWDAGAAMVAYVGHASAWQWAWTGPHEPVAHLLARSDAVRANGMRLPILLSMTCLSGSFANPTLTALDEELLRQPGGGVAAAFSPTGSGVNSGHASILSGMLPALAQGDSLGAAHLAGLQELVRSQADLHLAFGYGILGDPDVQMPAATLYQVALPQIYRS